MPPKRIQPITENSSKPIKMNKLTLQSTETPLSPTPTSPTPTDNNKKWLVERSRDAKMPDPSVVQDINPKYIFQENNLSFLLCNQCLARNRNGTMVQLADDCQRITISFCLICRNANNLMRSSKFFNWTLPVVRRDEESAAGSGIVASEE